MTIALIGAVPLLTALLLYGFGSLFNRAVWSSVLAVITGALFVLLITYLPAVTENGAVTLLIPWVPDIGLNLSFYLDGLALLFGLVITGVGVVIVLYTAHYFDTDEEVRRFYTLLFSFMGAMLMLVVSGNILTLFIAWELTSIISFLLISFKGDKSADAREGAARALVITGGGGLALLAGLMLLGIAGGSFEFSALLTNDTLRDHPWYIGMTVLILIGCFAKSAQFPLHFWLPGAMSAPSPASAYLHSATMVKAGVFLLARMYPTLGDTDFWFAALTTVGLATMLIGAVIAIFQRDLKGLLAYSTISWLGALVALLGQPDGAGLKAAMVGILAHALYKAALFLAAGAVDHAVHTRIIDKLGGLRHSLPGWAIITTISGLSMAGVPPLFGFLAKETLLEVAVESAQATIIMLVVTISATLTVTAGLIVVWDVFFRKAREEHQLHAPARGLAYGPGALAVGSLLMGFLIEPVLKPLINPVVGSPISLYLFHGINTPFILSMIALGGGGLIFLARDAWLRFTLPLPRAINVYNAIVGAVESFGDFLLRSQNGKLRHYLIAIMSAVALLLAIGVANYQGFENVTWLQIDDVTDLLTFVLLGLIVGATFGAIIARRRVTAALALAIGGYAVGGIFLIEPAPDVALVQFLVETLATVLLFIMLGRINPRQKREVMLKEARAMRASRFSLVRDILISSVIGLAVAFFAVAAVGERAQRETIAVWHLENAYPLIGVTDVVAAIVTDFRGTDTLLEITVFSMAALGVLSLLALRGSYDLLSGAREERVDDDDVPEADAPQFSTPFTRTIAFMVLPFALLVSLSHILYGGDAPGDGFTAGVISGLAVALWFVVYGYSEANRRLKWLKEGWLIGGGLTIALLNAFVPMLFGQPFFTHISFSFIPDFAGIHFASTLIFEFGIFLAVFGSVSKIMDAIAHPREVESI